MATVATMTSNPEFVPLGVAARRAGISRVTLRDRVLTGEVPVFRDARDRRYTLVRVVDVDRLSTPRPVAAPREEAVGVT